MHRHREWLGIALLLLSTVSVAAQPKKEPNKGPAVTDKHYRIYQGNGEPAAMDQMLQRLESADVVFLGEEHNDPVAHHLEATILQELDKRRKARASGKEAPRPLALSLEMFERDVQHVVDEYLSGLITETHFLASSRPWKNYKKDYRPLVEHAKASKLTVIAANAPRRYVNLVGREGKDALKKVQDSRQRGLPPLPYAAASPAYAAKFKAIMEKMKSKTPKKDDKKPNQPPKKPSPVKKPPPFDVNKALEAQCLWDASMACSIVEHLLRSPQSQVVHVNGSFHSEKRLGIPEHLARYRPGTSFVVVTMVADKGFPKFDAKEMSGAGDFVIVTDKSLPRSYSTPSSKE